jgi:hypothetical protein
MLPQLYETPAESHNYEASRDIRSLGALNAIYYEA